MLDSKYKCFWEVVLLHSEYLAEDIGPAQIQSRFGAEHMRWLSRRFPKLIGVYRNLRNRVAEA